MPPTAAPTAVPPTAEPQAAAPVTEAKPFVTWYQYDAGNVDPASDERGGNEWLRKKIPEFNKTYEGKWAWENQFTPWDMIEPNIITAVQSKAEVPDLVEIGTDQINNYYKNATFQDLKPWAEAQSWWSDWIPAPSSRARGRTARCTASRFRANRACLRLEGPLPQRLPQDAGAVPG